MTDSISDMLANSPISPTIPVVDLDRAKRFYETTLSLKPVPANNDNIVVELICNLRLSIRESLTY